MYTIGQVAKRFHLSRSTLLYYSEIGLLAPSARGASNYRMYSDDGLRRMERIRVYREAGLPLDAIARLLDEGLDAAPSLLEQHPQSLSREIERLRHQQRLIGQLLGGAPHIPGRQLLSKAQWVALLASSGMDEEGMHTWHAEFEKHFPAAHQEFLESLGISAEEIRAIRQAV